MKKTGLYKRMLEIAIIPVLTIGIVITCFCYIRFRNTIYARTRNEMRNIAYEVQFSYELAYKGDYSLVKGSDNKYDLYKGDAEITADYSIIDRLASIHDTDISLLYKDMRIHTTFKTDSGKRLAGVYANAETTATVINNAAEAYYENVPIIDKNYLVLYLPLKNSDGSVIGMLEIAKETSEIKKTVWIAIWPILLLAILGVGIALFFTYRTTHDITAVLKKLQLFLNKVAGGNLSTEIDSELLKRDDELGEITKSSVAMQKSIRSYVETDPLTQLGNRRFIHQSLAKIMDRHEETGVPFSLAICDIDFFKKVNDTYGHNAGDEVLKAVANILKRGAAGRGFAGRWGGEEFIIVFDKFDLKRSAEALAEILNEIRAMVVYTEGYTIQVTMTMGVVEGFKTSVEPLVESADARLYYGKQNGRNQIVTELPAEWLKENK